MSHASGAATPPRTAPLPRSTVLVYGSIGLPLAVIGYPIAIWLIPHYSGALGVSLAAVSTMLMLARITDVVTDPLIGEASDRSRTRFGRRRPWLIVGTPVMMIGIWMLFVPPEGVGTLYLLGWLTVMMLGSTLISLPYGAWGAELSPDYHERARVTASRELYVLLGLLVAAFVPFLVEAAGVRRSGPVLAALAWTIVVVLPASVAVVVWRVPEPEARRQPKVPITQGIAAFTALQRRGIPSRFLYFPDENHWVLKPHNSLQWHAEVNAWLHRWLTDGSHSE